MAVERYDEKPAGTVVPTKILLLADPVTGFLEKVTVAQLVAMAQKTITDADSPYTVLDTDRTIFADANGADVIILLPSVAANSGREIIIKKIDISGNRVSVTPDGADEIEGSSSVLDIVTTMEGFRFQSNGVITWWSVGRMIP